MTEGKDENVSVEPGGIRPGYQRNNVKKYDSILKDYKKNGELKWKTRCRHLMMIGELAFAI